MDAIRLSRSIPLIAEPEVLVAGGILDPDWHARYRASRRPR